MTQPRSRNPNLCLSMNTKLTRALATPRPQRSHRNIRMAKSPAAQPSYLQPRLTIRIWACDLPIRRYPVIWVRRSLFGCQQWQDGTYKDYHTIP